MKHARPDYDVIQDTHDKARQLAELVIDMDMVTEKGQAARALARDILGIENLHPAPAVITTNGTTRLIPADEPVFLVRGQDENGADTVCYWANRAEERGADPEIVRVARAHAELMGAWPKKKRPDLPTTPAQE